MPAQCSCSNSKAEAAAASPQSPPPPPPPPAIAVNGRPHPLSPTQQPQPPRYRQRPEDIDPAAAAVANGHAAAASSHRRNHHYHHQNQPHNGQRRSRRNTASSASAEDDDDGFTFDFYSLLSAAAKIVLSMGLWLWFLAARAALRRLAEAARRFAEEQRRQIHLLRQVNAADHEANEQERPAARENQDVLSGKTANGAVVTLRLRHSLKKRKEQILFRSPRGSPVSLCNASLFT